MAREMASRRHQLMDLARQSLTTMEWLQFDRPEPAQIPDSEAARLCRALGKCGLHVPDMLSVPLSYEGIFLNGGLQLAHFPIFFQEGFLDINRRSSQGLLPLMVAGPILYVRVGNQNMSERQDEWRTLQWLSKHGCLDHCTTDPHFLGLNTTACGWHYMAQKLLELERFYATYVTPINGSDYLRKVGGEVFMSEAADSCDCLCNDTGCQPFHIFLKGWITTNEGRSEGYDFRRNLLYLEYFSNNNAALLLMFLRFITFEALEMTHTCCYVDEIVPATADDGRPCSVLKTYRGDAEDVLSEQQHQKEMLETLMDEFKELWARMTEKDLEYFVCWGPWRRRMAEVCVPSEEDYQTMAAAGVNVDKNCESGMLANHCRRVLTGRVDRIPSRLLCLLGDDFDFLEPLEDSSDGSESFLSQNSMQTED